MGSPVRILWSEDFAAYDFGPDHPMRPERLALTMALARRLGILDGADVTVTAPSPAGDDLLALVHTRDYLTAVRAASVPGGRGSARHGLGTADNPVFAGMHDVSALVVGASVMAAAAVWAGEVAHAVNLAGGLHHAMPGYASGFCVYNDPTVAIAWLLEQGVERVAYVDIDVHHGDGVQAAFYDDPRVLTISLHESGHYLFPGSGFPDEVGAGPGVGFSVNVALPPGTGDAGWLRAFHAVVPPLLEVFAPQVLVSQHGCDSHALDPQADLELSLDGQLAAAGALHELAHRPSTAGRWVVLGGGGYDPERVVSRSWAGLLAEVAGVEVDLTDGADAVYLPWPEGENRVDEAILATRAAVFPTHGLPVE